MSSNRIGNRKVRPNFVRSSGAAPVLPSSDEAIAYATVAQLSRWIESKALTSERLTGIYLDRLEHFDPKLHCVITLTRDHALTQARQADEEIAAGHYRGPLHGIPWGAKDLLDTANIPTTYGAEPFRKRVPKTNSTVVARLNAAGAVLVAKLSLGALALNDIWFGGQTMNPWLLEEGSSGSSAGPGAAVAAGLVGFAIGSETEGSIVSPSMRCGITGLRPTFGRVPRTGAMTLCWSLDKLGPMTRGVEDTMLVLKAISGPDPGDLASVPSELSFHAGANVAGLRVGYFPDWMKEPPATDVDRAALATVKKLGMTPVEVSLPDWPYDSLNLILFSEAAAAFQELTLSHKVDQLKMQVPDAWPNVFRQSQISLRGRFRAGRSLPPQGRAGDGAHFLPSRLCCLCLRCATRCSPSPTSPAIRRWCCAPDLSKSRRRAATGRPIRSIRCRSSPRRAAFRTGYVSSAGCSKKEQSPRPAWRWRRHSTLRRNIHPGSRPGSVRGPRQGAITRRR